jgi:hypothetical protein
VTATIATVLNEWPLGDLKNLNFAFIERVTF